MAVDLKLLELTRLMFLRMAPNVTAWSAGLEDYALEADLDMAPRVSARTHPYLSNSSSPILQSLQRNRLGRCIQWYGQMVNTVEHIAQQIVNEILEPVDEPSSEVHLPDHSASASSSNDGGSIKDTPLIAASRTRPSAYLRLRCSLCFGGKYTPPREGDDP